MREWEWETKKTEAIGKCNNSDSDARTVETSNSNGSDYENGVQWQ